MEHFVKVVENIQELDIKTFTIEVLKDDAGYLWLVDAYDMHYEPTPKQ